MCWYADFSGLVLLLGASKPRDGGAEDEVWRAEEIHDRMERVFELLEQFDYPDSILPGMKHRRDTTRKTLENTRADITRAVRERNLEEILNSTERKLED